MTYRLAVSLLALSLSPAYRSVSFAIIIPLLYLIQSCCFFSASASAQIGYLDIERRGISGVSPWAEKVTGQLRHILSNDAIVVEA